MRRFSVPFTTMALVVHTKYRTKSLNSAKTAKMNEKRRQNGTKKRRCACAKLSKDFPWKRVFFSAAAVVDSGSNRKQLKTKSLHSFAALFTVGPKTRDDIHCHRDSAGDGRLLSAALFALFRRPYNMFSIRGRPH